MPTPFLLNYAEVYNVDLSKFFFVFDLEQLARLNQEEAPYEIYLSKDQYSCFKYLNQLGVDFTQPLSQVDIFKCMIQRLPQILVLLSSGNTSSFVDMSENPKMQLLLSNLFEKVNSFDYLALESILADKTIPTAPLTPVEVATNGIPGYPLPRFLEGKDLAVDAQTVESTSMSVSPLMDEVSVPMDYKPEIISQDPQHMGFYLPSLETKVENLDSVLNPEELADIEKLLSNQLPLTPEEADLALQAEGKARMPLASTVDPTRIQMGYQREITSPELKQLGFFLPATDSDERAAGKSRRHKIKKPISEYPPEKQEDMRAYNRKFAHLHREKAKHIAELKAQHLADITMQQKELLKTRDELRIQLNTLREIALSQLKPNQGSNDVDTSTYPSARGIVFGG